VEHDDPDTRTGTSEKSGKGRPKPIGDIPLSKRRCDVIEASMAKWSGFGTQDFAQFRVRRIEHGCHHSVEVETGAGASFHQSVEVFHFHTFRIRGIEQALASADELFEGHIRGNDTSSHFIGSQGGFDGQMD